jgi:CDP-diacylglycerol--glycerol-3-phosphate 3-phosphatidyltransferase
MPIQPKINWRDFFLIPNIFSILRILLTPFIAYSISIDTTEGILTSVTLLAIAGITDYFDGYFARRLNKITTLGLILDPVADKILTITLIVELIFYRGFPLWFAIAVIARDLIIMLTGLMILRRRRISLPSNLTGKYYFSAIAILIFSHIVRFPFGQMIFLVIGIILLVFSSINYARVFYLASQGRELPVFHDKPILKWSRVMLMLIILMVSLYKCYLEVFIYYIQGG